MPRSSKGGTWDGRRWVYCDVCRKPKGRAVQSGKQPDQSDAPFKTFEACLIDSARQIGALLKEHDKKMAVIKEEISRLEAAMVEKRAALAVLESEEGRWKTMHELMSQELNPNSAEVA
jgi:hypothetical protein